MCDILLDSRMKYNSGIGTYIRNVHKEIITSSNLSIKEIGVGKDSDYICNSKIYSIREQISIPKIIKSVNPRTFWSPHYNFPLISNSKRVVTVHDVYHLAFINELSLPKKIYAKTFFSRLSSVEKIITVSDFSANEIMKYTGINSKKVSVIKLGVDKFWSEKIEIEDSQFKPYILFVGNLKANKNLEELVTAFSLIKDKVPHNLLVVGKIDGFKSERINIDKMKKELGERIHFLGQVDDHKLRELYSCAEVFVFPSLYEGFGLPPLEAMSTRTPVIASNRASIPEVCGEAALYYSPGNALELSKAINDVIKNKSLQEELIEKGSKRVNLFKWKDTGSKTVELFRDLLNE